MKGSAWETWTSAARSIRDAEGITTAEELARRLEAERSPETWARESADQVFAEPAPDPQAAATESVECAVNFSTGEFSERPDPQAAAMAAGMGAVEKALEPAADVLDLYRLGVEVNQRSRREAERQWDELADALEACRKVLLAVNAAHRPGTAIPGFDGALAATDAATEALRKAGRS